MANGTEQGNGGKSIFKFALIILILLVGVLVFGLYKNTPDNIESDLTSREVTNAPEYTDTPAPEDVDVEAAASAEEPVIEPETATTATVAMDLDIAALAAPRFLGNPDAPIEISEHSSFTCGGCGAFHKENFKSIKRDYIDTGKAYIVFDDFPRNRPDVVIGAIARCVPIQSYFSFVQMVFETQQDWMKDDYITYIKQNAQMTGASAERVAACAESTPLHEALAQRQQLAVQEHDVKSTPTLVLNNKTVISGLAPYEDIKAALDAAYNEAEQQ